MGAAVPAGPGARAADQGIARRVARLGCSDSRSTCHASIRPRFGASGEPFYRGYRQLRRLAMPFTTGHALLIGVNAYPNASWMNVNQTKADAEAVAGVLRDEQYCGYPDAQVALLTDSRATRQDIL